VAGRSGNSYRSEAIMPCSGRASLLLSSSFWLLAYIYEMISCEASSNASRPHTERPAVTNPSATVAPSVAEGSGHAIQKMTDPARGVTVERIVDEINSSPPYQKDTIAKNFTGLERTCAPWQIAKKVNPKLDAGEGLLSCRHRLS